MTTAKELNEAVADGVKFADDDVDSEKYSLSEVIREESDVDLGPLGILTYVDSFRDRDEPDVWIVLYEHEGLLYAVYGYYDSWNGVEFHDVTLRPVKKVEKTVTDYVKREEA